MTRIPIVLILLGNIVFCDETVSPEAGKIKDVTRKEGEHVSFQCGVSNLGSSGRSVVVWRRGYTVLSTGQILLSRDLRLSVGHQGNLHISSLSHNDTGEYVCQVTSLTGEVLEEVHRLRVVVAATVRAEKGRVEARLGERVTLRCAGHGVPKPSLHWYKSVGSLSGDVGCSGSCLTLGQVSLAAGGDYICSASNGVGLPVHAIIQLAVLFQPKVRRSDLHMQEDGARQVRLECDVTGEPRPAVTWYREEERLNISGRLAGQEVEVGGQVWRHVLTITDLSDRDYGNYSCLAANKVGSDRSFIELDGRPSIPIISPARGSFLSWTVASHEPVDLFRVLLRKRLDWRVRNVTEMSQYDCIVQAHNRHGWSLPSTITTYTPQDTLGQRMTSVWSSSSVIPTTSLPTATLLFLFSSIVLPTSNGQHFYVIF